jgi:NAD(P)-dependent dehydrogenase (short-subunit alcohol dehydrogenase family)
MAPALPPRNVGTMMIDQQIAVIGGTSGLGFAVAKMAADAGADVVLVGSNRERVDAAVRRLYGKVRGEIVDVRSEEAVSEFFEKAGELDHIVSTVGHAYQPAHVRDTKREDVEALVAVKYWGQLFIAKHAAPRLVENGSLTLTSGVLSQRPAEGFGVLASINAGIEALARTLALELSPLRVNVVCPGFIDTGKLWPDLAENERTEKLWESKAKNLPAQRVGLAQDGAKTYLYVMENPYVTGQTLVVDGGSSLT